MCYKYYEQLLTKENNIWINKHRYKTVHKECGFGCERQHTGKDLKICLVGEVALMGHLHEV